jgi:hypothetical protein
MDFALPSEPAAVQGAAIPVAGLARSACPSALAAVPEISATKFEPTLNKVR